MNGSEYGIGMDCPEFRYSSVYIIIKYHSLILPHVEHMYIYLVLVIFLAHPSSLRRKNKIKKIQKGNVLGCKLEALIWFIFIHFHWYNEVWILKMYKNVWKWKSRVWAYQGPPTPPPLIKDMSLKNVLPYVCILSR